MRYKEFPIRKEGIFRPGAYCLAPSYFRIAQRRTERWRVQFGAPPFPDCPAPHRKVEEIKGLRGCVHRYAAQENPKIDPALAGPGRKRALSGWKLAPICFTQHKTGYNIIASKIAGFIADRKVGVAHVQQMNMNPYPVNITAGSAPAFSLYISSSNVTI